MPDDVTLELRILGMDCAACARHVRSAIAGVPGVQGVQVWFAAEKAVVRLDPQRADLEGIRRTVQAAGYMVADARAALSCPVEHPNRGAGSPGAGGRHKAPNVASGC